jgi:hypothetical protein
MSDPLRQRRAENALTRKSDRVECAAFTADKRDRAAWRQKEAPKAEVSRPGMLAPAETGFVRLQIESTFRGVLNQNACKQQEKDRG